VYDCFVKSKLFEATMPKALDSLVDLYVKLKKREALQSLLERRQSTHSDFERLDASSGYLVELAQEIEIIKAGLDLLREENDPAKTTLSSEVKITGITVSSPAESVDPAPSARNVTVAVTGVSISVSPLTVETDPSHRDN
jgi:hypothetical protein